MSRYDGIEDGYRPAKNGEEPDMVMNGIPVVQDDKQSSSGFWGSSSRTRGYNDAEDGYRPAKKGENPYMTMNGTPFVKDGDSRSGGGFFGNMLGRITNDQDERFGDHDSSSDRRSKAANGLLNGEDRASKNKRAGGKEEGSLKGTGGMNAAKKTENNIQSNADSFKNSVTGKDDNKNKNKFSAKNLIKKAMPIMMAGAGVGGFGILSYFGQLAMPVSLISQFIGNFDSMGVSSLARTTRFTRWQMHPDTRRVSGEAQLFVKQHSKIYQFATGSDEKYFKITDRQANKLSKHNIEVIDDATAGTIMKYKTPSGEEIEIVADASKATGGRVTIDDIYESNVEFRTDYHKGTRTWRQSVSDWFDGLSVKFLNKIKVARNRFQGYDASADNEKAKADYEETVKSSVDGDGVNGKTGERGIDEKKAKAADGTETTYYDVDDTGSESMGLPRGAKASEIRQKLTDFSNGVGAKISKVAETFVNSVCMASQIVGAINMLVMANEAIQILQITSTIFEGIQKGQIADSSESPINEISNSLTRKKKVSYQVIDDAADDKTKIVEGKEKSAMEANAVSALYGNIATDPNDLSVNSFNLTDSISHIMGSLGDIGTAFGNSMTAYKSCLIAKLGAGAVDAVLDGIDVATDALSVVACVAGAAGTFGLSCLGAVAKIVAKVAGMIALTATISAIVGIVVSYLVPKVATMLARDLATDIGGEDLGNALVSGANMYMGQNHQYGGGSIATKDTLMTYLKQKEVYIADQARYERETKSPFDISSPYTFMGSLFSKSVPLLTQTSSITSGIKNITTIAGNALSSLIPGASAVTAAKTAQAAAENTAKTCPELDSIGGVGDAFCNPYFITDLSTMDIDPAQVAYNVSEYKKNEGNENFKLSDNEDNPAINTEVKKSNLMKYIVYCGQRSSTFGMADQNIANAINSGAGNIEGAVPVWGGIADMLQNNDLINNVGYISGEACVTNNTGEGMGVDTITWREASLYQRYIEDQRLAESEGLIEKSAVSVALEEYYSEHPIDDSYEGLLAAKMGVTKEYLSETLDILSGMMWIANYDPSDYYPYKIIEEETEREEVEVDYGLVGLSEYAVDSDKRTLSLRREYLII